MTCTIEQTIALVLGIHIEPRKGRPWWVRKHGAVIRELGPCAEHGLEPIPGEPAPLELSEAIAISMREVNLRQLSEFTTIPANSSRAMLYVLLEADMMRQEKLEKHPLWMLMGSHPSEGMECIMAQMRNCAVDIGANRVEALVRSAQHLTTLAMAYWEWCQNWFATLQKQNPQPMEGARIFTFPQPTGKIAEPTPLKPLEEKKPTVAPSDFNPLPSEPHAERESDGSERPNEN